MRKVPFSEQTHHRPRGPERFSPAKRLFEQQGWISGEMMATILQSCRGEPMPDWLNEHLVNILPGLIKPPPGRRQDDPTWRDFVCCLAEDRYRTHLRRIQEEDRRMRAEARRNGRVRSKAEGSPSDRAYEEVAKDMQRFRANCSGKHWRNMLSAWRTELRTFEYPEDPEFDFEHPDLPGSGDA
jgi:hypothetical protein